MDREAMITYILEKQRKAFELLTDKQLEDFINNLKNTQTGS